MHPTPYITLPDVIDREELRAWKENMDTKSLARNCPKELIQFINAIDNELPAFGQIGKESVSITGYELHLANIHHLNGEKIFRGFLYELPVPKMVAVNHKASMIRLWNKKGRSGIEQYLRAHVRAERIDHVLAVLRTEVYHEERPEFIKVMEQMR